MGEARQLTERRLKEILRRQLAPSFGPGYEPSMRATREEAPSRSRFAAVWSEQLGRYVHALSSAERDVVALLLYCPRLFELQEQRMLPFVAAPHPLHGHPFAEGLQLKGFRGTLAVADELHHMSFHPFVQIGGEDVPGCWIGDFLIFLQDTNGPYCVNINVKQTRSAFTSPDVGVTVKTDMARATARNKVRYEVERVLYAEIGIRTVEVAANEISPILVANLMELLGWQKRRHSLSAEQVQIVLDGFNEGLQCNASPLEVMAAVELTHGIGPYDQRIVLEQGIFKRKIRVDLLENHLFVDKPMRVESRDALEVYANLFDREA